MTEKDSSLRFGAWLFLGFTAFLVVLMIILARPFIIAIVVGGMMATVLNPWYKSLCTKMKRHVAAGVATLSLSMLVIVPILLIALVALRDATILTTKLSSDTTIELFKTWWSHWRMTLEGTAQTYLPWLNVVDFEGHALSTAKLLFDWISNTIIEMASQVPSLLLQLLMGILSCYFWLVDGRRFIVLARTVAPVSDAIRSEVIEAFRDATRSTVVASLAAALSQSMMVIITFIALGIPATALAAGATFILAWVPVLGCLPIFAIAAIWAIAQNAWIKFVLILLAGVLTGFIDNIVRPWVLKGGSDMHPLVSLVAIMGGLEFFGLLGVLLGPVIVATFLACARVWPHLATEAGWFEQKQKKQE